jgi:hypothetical protein
MGVVLTVTAGAAAGAVAVGFAVFAGAVAEDANPGAVHGGVVFQSTGADVPFVAVAVLGASRRGWRLLRRVRIIVRSRTDAGVADELWRAHRFVLAL